MRADELVVIFLNKFKRISKSSMNVYLSGVQMMDYLIKRMNNPNFPNRTKFPYMVTITYEDWENHDLNEVQEMIDEGIIKIFKTAEIQNTKKNHWIGELK